MSTMMLRKTNNIIDNILLSGYLREEEETLQMGIPQLVESVISVYCKEYVMHGIGASSKKQTISDPLDVLDTLQSVHSSEFRVFQTNADQSGILKQINIRTSDYVSEGISEHTSVQIKEMMDNANDKVVDIQNGKNHTLFLTFNGHVYALGSNDNGQCGLSSQITHTETPHRLPFQCKIKSIACGDFHSLFLNDNGQLLVSGYNFVGQLGISHKSTEGYDTGTATEESRDSSSDYDFAYDSDEDSHSDFCDLFECASQRVFTPIYNEYFENLKITFQSISCGTNHSLCITSKGECYTFGHNESGELGNGKQSEYGRGENIPFKIQTTETFVSGVCGSNNNFLTTANGEMMVWGNNRKHQCSAARTEALFTRPYMLSKPAEFGIEQNQFISSVVSNKSDEVFAIIDVYKRRVC